MSPTGRLYCAPQMRLLSRASTSSILIVTLSPLRWTRPDRTPFTPSSRPTCRGSGGGAFGSLVLYLAPRGGTSPSRSEIATDCLSVVRVGRQASNQDSDLHQLSPAERLKAIRSCVLASPRRKLHPPPQKEADRQTRNSFFAC